MDEFVRKQEAIPTVIRHILVLHATEQVTEQVRTKLKLTQDQIAVLEASITESPMPILHCRIGGSEKTGANAGSSGDFRNSLAAGL